MPNPFELSDEILAEMDRIAEANRAYEADEQER